MRGYLLVAAHPYYTPVDERGRFTLKDVPAGTYELVAWHPNWRVTGQTRNPDSARVQQVTYRSPLEGTMLVTVEAGKATMAKVELPVQ